jgi:hypothetical protein
MGLCTAAATLLTSVIDRQAMSGSTAMMSNKKQREVYVGNLTIGVVNDVMLRDLFNGALSHLVADPHVNPPVVSTSMDPSGEGPPRSRVVVQSISSCRCPESCGTP